MKFRLPLTASALLLGAAVSLSAADQPAVPVASAPAAPPKADAAPGPKFTDAQILETLGWLMGQQDQVDHFEFTPDELASVTKGYALFASGKDMPYKQEEIKPQFSAFMDDRIKTAQKHADEKRANATKQNKADGEKFLADIKTHKGVIVLPDGLMYEIIQPGTGAFPKATDTVRVNYTGTFIDGKVFDSTSNHDPVAPAEFPLNKVVPGWTEGIQKINKGGKIKLYLPSDLAYGEEGNQGIPPASTLVFEVELLDINPPAATPAK
jgi:FKBP-type peptidyl-prolyl cis-trans isomerase